MGNKCRLPSVNRKPKVCARKGRVIKYDKYRGRFRWKAKIRLKETNGLGGTLSVPPSEAMCLPLRKREMGISASVGSDAAQKCPKKDATSKVAGDVRKNGRGFLQGKERPKHKTCTGRRHKLHRSQKKKGEGGKSSSIGKRSRYPMLAGGAFIDLEGEGKPIINRRRSQPANGRVTCRKKSFSAAMRVLQKNDLGPGKRKRITKRGV